MNTAWVPTHSPFLGPLHDELHTRLLAWVQHNLSQFEAIEAQPLNDQCAYWLRNLNELGVLQYAVPPLEHVLQRAPQHMPDVDLRAICIVRECLGYYAPVADFVFSMQGIGAAALWKNECAAELMAYVQASAVGQKVAAFAVTEPDGGSDVAATRTVAVDAAGGYRIHGKKTYISNGGIADYYVVIARTEEAQGANGLSAFLVDADTPGLCIAKQIDIVAPHPLAEIHFEDCQIPANRLIGRRGEGFKVAMSVLDIFRSSVGAAALGMGQRAMDETIHRMRTRQLFGKAMAEMDVVKHTVADMATQLEAARLLVHQAAWRRDVQRQRISKEAAMAKMYGTEAAFKVIDAAVQLWGSMGITCGSVMERLYREIRPMRIYEGATEVQKTIIGRHLLR